MNIPTVARQRPSISEKVHELQHDTQHHLSGPFVGGANANGGKNPPVYTNGKANGQNGHAKPRPLPNHMQLPPRQGVIRDIISLRWTRVPSSSIKGVLLPIILWAQWKWISPDHPNPFEPLLFISHRVPGSADSDPRYQKGYGDLLFLAYYTVVFSFLRQFIMIHIFHRIAWWWGIRSNGKLDRFGEQGYGFLYWGFMSIWGLYVMRTLPTWYYRTEYFWKDYPHWDMPANLKQYYLTQAAFWLQQFLVLVLKLERPRSDFTELCIHHVVTLWLIGWSYIVNLTLIGNAIFVSMDLPDTLLAGSKLLNYMESPVKNVTFAIFVVAWSYFRHYLNILIIISGWNEFHLMPDSSKKLDPLSGVWMAGWMQYQVLLPIILLQLVNIFWYYLIWRVMLRAIFSSELDDDRSDDEGDAEEDTKEE